MAMYSVMTKEELKKAKDSIEKIEDAMETLEKVIDEISDISKQERLALKSAFNRMCLDIASELENVNPDAYSDYNNECIDRYYEGWG